MKNTDLHFKIFNFTHAETMQTNWYKILVWIGVSINYTNFGPHSAEKNILENSKIQLLFKVNE